MATPMPHPLAASPVRTQIVLANVVVAVLLDKFVENEPEAPADGEAPPSADDFLGGMEPISEDGSGSELAGRPGDMSSPAGPSTPTPPKLPAAVPLPSVRSGPPSNRPTDANAKLDAVLTELAMLRSGMAQMTAEVRCCREDIDAMRQGGAPGAAGMSA